MLSWRTFGVRLSCCDLEGKIEIGIGVITEKRFWTNVLRKTKKEPFSMLDTITKDERKKSNNNDKNNKKKKNSSNNNNNNRNNADNNDNKNNNKNNNDKK